MSEALLKALKWLILVECAIIGTTAFIISNDRDTVAPIMVGILAYGVVYIMSYFWKEFRDKLLLMSVGVFLGLTYASIYTPIGMYILFGIDPAWFDEFYTWAATVAVGGVPIMMVIFKIYD